VGYFLGHPVGVLLLSELRRYTVCRGGWTRRRTESCGRKQLNEYRLHAWRGSNWNNSEA